MRVQTVPGRAPHNFFCQFSMEARMSDDTKFSAPHGTKPGALRIPPGTREPFGALFHRKEPVSLPPSTRPAPSRHLAGIWPAHLRAPCVFTRPSFTGKLQDAAEYVTTHAVEMKIPKGPVRFLKSTTVRRVGNILRGTLYM